MKLWASALLSVAAMCLLTPPVTADLNVTQRDDADVLTSTTQRIALPYPTPNTPLPRVLGRLSELKEDVPLSVTVVLRLRNIKEAESLLEEIHTPGGHHFGRHLTSWEFEKRFGPLADDVARVIDVFSSSGLNVERVTSVTLRATGLPKDFESIFQVELFLYSVDDAENAYTFHAPLSPATVPSQISDVVLTVVGLDSRPRYRPRSIVTPNLIRSEGTVPNDLSSDYAYNPVGYWTVTDFAHYYNAAPLYKKGVTGKRQTLAILTFASFTPSDAFAYWESLGISVNPDRLTIIDVDGGPGAPSDASGSIETTLDVEQSGGIAPDANILLYQAPNTNQGFVDVFAQAFSDNKATSVSISWGFYEYSYILDTTPVIDPNTGKPAGVIQAIHEQLIRAAIQGQSVYAASGDGGGYDANLDLGCYGPYSPSKPTSCSLTVTVNHPASDPLITAVGGTTLPADFYLCSNCPTPFPVSIPRESVWGWDYLTSFCSAVHGLDPIDCGIFPIGGGGGVSVVFGKPSYQRHIHVTQRSQANQLFQGFGSSSSLPANFSGRNVPDVSFNSDPETGYKIYYTGDDGVTKWYTHYGGTSFASPQLNGVTVLLGQFLHTKRLGLLNYPMYDLLRKEKAYDSPNAPLNRIKDGSNWVYRGSPGYNAGAGVGTMNVLNFAKYLREYFDA